MTFFRPLTLLSLLFLAGLTGCTSTTRLVHDSPQQAYERGMELFERGRYERAIEYFQAVFDYGRTNEWADEAQLQLARAYAESKQYILAAAEYTRFVDFYRTDPRAAEAEYERALAYEALSPQYQLDQTETQRAIDFFRLFITRYPNDPRVAEAEASIQELRDKMARKSFESAGLYERRELYEAAAVTYERTFQDYPETSWADDALIGAMRAYLRFADESVAIRQQERYEKAQANYERFAQLFPQSPLRAEAEDLSRQIQSRLNTFTAGR